MLQGEYVCTHSNDDAQKSLRKKAEDWDHLAMVLQDADRYYNAPDGSLQKIVHSLSQDVRDKVLNIMGLVQSVP